MDWVVSTDGAGCGFGKAIVCGASRTGVEDRGKTGNRIADSEIKPSDPMLSRKQRYKMAHMGQLSPAAAVIP
jgi:hypothetical protein